MSEPYHTDAEIRPFRIEVPQDDLDDLQYRLTRTRWANELPPEERGSGSPAGSTASQSPMSRSWSSTGATATTGASRRRSSTSIRSSPPPSTGRTSTSCT
jgi:hypothetical protein